MFIAESTFGTHSFTAFDTAEEAVSFLLDMIGSDYSDFFRASDDGKNIVNYGGGFDFDISVHETIQSAISAQMDLDEDYLPHVLRLIADAVEAKE